MNMQMTQHAAIRQQQRGIPPLIMEWLSQYGACRHDHRGAEIVSRLSALLDTYAVVSDAGTVITVGHRFKRVSH